MAEKVQEAPFVGPYVLQNVLGKGQTGVVKLGVHSITKKKVAVKIIDRTKLAPHILTKVEREIAIMKLINHPNILGLYDVYENKRNLYLILEYVGGGELFEYLVKKKRLQLPEARKFFRQIVSAVNFCHQHLVCHRDLKPENLLLDNKKNVKIADFGMASVQLSDCMLETSCGSPHYAAPEVVKGIRYDGRKADVWSCGVILYALIVGCLPFDDDNLRHLLDKVKKGVFVIPGFVPADCRDLLTQMIKVDPEERLTMSQVRKHRFFKSEDLSPEPPVQQITETHSINDESELDSDILNSMTSLGCFKDKENLIAKLLSQENTLERVIYFLLMDRKNKISHKDEETLNHNFLPYQADPPRKRTEHRPCKDDSASLHSDKEKPVLTKKRAMTYHGNTLDSTIGSMNLSGDLSHSSSGNQTPPTPPGSPWRSRLHALKRSVGAGIFARKRSQSSEETGKLENVKRAGSSPDIAVKRSWFTSLLFHAPGQIQPAILKFDRRSTEDLKTDLERALNSVPKISYSVISQQEFHIVYKRGKSLYHRKTLINLRFEIASYNKAPETETYPIIVKINFVDGSHRKFRKFCLILEEKLTAEDQTDYHQNGVDTHHNDGLSDDYLSSGTSLEEDSHSNELNFAAHSTENLLDTDDSSEF